MFVTHLHWVDVIPASRPTTTWAQERSMIKTIVLVLMMVVLTAYSAPVC